MHAADFAQAVEISKMAKGMSSIRMHRSDTGVGASVDALSVATEAAPGGMRSTDAETAARRYLNAMFTADAGMSALHRETNEERPEFRYIGIDKVPFTKSQHVKFRQNFHKVPVYGSIVTVELGPENEFISINSSLGDPSNIDPVATVSPADALKRVRRLAGYQGEPMNSPARLYYYYDPKPPRWRLVYIFEDVLRMKPRTKSAKDSLSALPETSDFVIDAHSGELVDELPRTQTVAEQDAVSQANDGLGSHRDFGIVVDTVSNIRRMHDRARNIRTHDFKFKDAFFQQNSLPGGFLASPLPESWDPGGVSAHANAVAVIDFLRNVLQRDGLDDQGGPIVSTVNCVFQSVAGGQEWRNAARFRGQMIYGQRSVNGALRSYAVSLDVVAHELLHGLTENTARLEYRFESGALNESFSDIFGVIVSNLSKPDVGTWNWEIGEDLSDTGVPLRNMSDPTLRGQPAHMDDFVVLPEEADHGGVHTNSGIHNFAAFQILNAQDGAGGLLFSPTDVARLYYVTLIAHLSRTSDFSDCREGMVLAAKSMFDASDGVDSKVVAIEAAYDAVGIRPTGIV